MIRDKLFGGAYFDQWIEFVQTTGINPRKSSIASLPRPEGRIGRATDLWVDSVQLVIMRYSRGDSIPNMADSVMQMIELLNLKHTALASAQLEKDVRNLYERLDLGTLYEYLTLLSFIVSLRASAQIIHQTFELIDHVGEDALLDYIARGFGDKTRSLAPHSKFPKIYDPLLEVIAAPVEQRPTKLHKYVEGWYKKMKPIYWHDNHKGAEGAYFGYWCFEAALVAMLWQIDDAAITEHPNYPADLVRHYRTQTG
jgi:hypothetical protein